MEATQTVQEHLEDLTSCAWVIGLVAMAAGASLQGGEESEQRVAAFRRHAAEALAGCDALAFVTEDGFLHRHGGPSCRKRVSLRSPHSGAVRIRRPLAAACSMPCPSLR